MKVMNNQTKSLITQTEVLCTYKRINGIEEIAFIKGGNMYGIRRPKQKHLNGDTIDRKTNKNVSGSIWSIQTKSLSQSKALSSQMRNYM